MSLIRPISLFCVTTLLCVGGVLFSLYDKNRFEIVPMQGGVFVFDRYTSASNFCNANKCLVLSSEFLIPKKILVSEIPGVITKAQLQVQNAKNKTTPHPSKNHSTDEGENEDHLNTSPSNQKTQEGE